MLELGLRKIIPQKLSYLEQKRQSWVVKRNRLLKLFGEASAQNNPRRMSYICRQIQQISEFLECLEKLSTEAPPQMASFRQYVVSSLFLYQCYKDLTADRDEQFFFITGSEVSGVLVLDQKAEFLQQKRTVVAVVGNPVATHQLLIKLEQFGHRLLAHFHSHPGNGLDSTHPSGTDNNFQNRLERAGYPTVAAIFSRDGYIRFFRSDNNLEIQIHGKGVEHLGNYSYRLTDINQN